MLPSKDIPLQQEVCAPSSQTAQKIGALKEYSRPIAVGPVYLCGERSPYLSLPPPALRVMIDRLLCIKYIQQPVNCCPEDFQGI